MIHLASYLTASIGVRTDDNYLASILIRVEIVYVESTAVGRYLISR